MPNFEMIMPDFESNEIKQRNNVSNRVAYCLVIGHSHIVCLQHAHEISHWETDIDFMQLHEMYEKKYHPPLLRNGQTLVLNQALATDVREWADVAVQGGHDSIIVLSIAGNQHNILGLAKHPQPFDFVLPEYPDLPLDRGAYIIPFQAMKAVLRCRCEAAFQIASRLSELLPRPFYWLEPPPPIADESYILSHASIFKEAFDTWGITAAPIRLKLWKLQSSVTREFCFENGWEYISTPEEAQDEQGFLAKEAWSDLDPVHGNEWYGRLLLEKLRSKFGEKNEQCVQPLS